jgi:predicted molibdopterin-dependent oxidoreductase YjgC
MARINQDAAQFESRKDARLTLTEREVNALYWVLEVASDGDMSLDRTVSIAEEHEADWNVISDLLDSHVTNDFA